MGGNFANLWVYTHGNNLDEIKISLVIFKWNLKQMEGSEVRR